MTSSLPLAPARADPDPFAPARPAAFLLLGAAVFVACVAGTLTRPINMLAALWPANALMLGLLLRHPPLGRSAWGWLAGAAAYLLSALAMGDAPLKALWLSGANLAGVLTGWLYFSRLDRRVVLLRDQLSPLYVVGGCLLASLAAALAGFGVGPALYGSQAAETFFMWATAELMSFMFVLPVVLSFSGAGEARGRPQAPDASSRGAGRAQLADAAPVLALAVSELLAYFVGGPGSLAFGMPALLWCALRYRLFTTAVLCLAVGTFKSVTLPMGMLSYTSDALRDVGSLRFALALMSLGPLAVACSQALRDELLSRLEHAARHDGLTDVLLRAAFIDQGDRLLQRLLREGQPVAVLMLDVDHFKAINDQHGHAAGDDVLRALARRLEHLLRPGDLLGRLGGEEFAVVLPGVALPGAESIARRLCDATRKQRFALSGGGEALRVTVSIGVAHAAAPGPHTTMDRLLRQADQALYEAKGAGRDRHVVHAQP